MSAAPIVQKILKRYRETHENSCMIVNPDTKWNIIKSSNDGKEIKAYMQSLLKEGKYDGLCLIYVGGNEKKEEINVSVDFHYYKDNKFNAGKSFGRSIIFSKETLITLNDVTHETIYQVVQKMKEKGKKEFEGLKPYYYNKLFNL